MANKTYYLDVLSRQWRDADGAITQRDIPQLVAGVVESYAIIFQEGETPLDLSAFDGFMFSIDKDYDDTSDPMCRSLSTDGNIDATDKATGKLIIKIDTTTDEYAAALDTADKLSVHAELQCFISSVKRFAAQGDVVAWNTVDRSGGSAPSSLPATYPTTGGTVTPDPYGFFVSLYIDADKNQWCDINGAYVNPPSLFYAAAMQFKITVMGTVAGTWQALDLSGFTAFYTCCDKSFQAAPPAVRSPSDSIDATDKANGVLFCVYDTRTSQYKALVGTSAKADSGWFQLYGLDSDSEPKLAIILPIDLRNAVDGGGDTQPSVVGNYYTKSESDARYSRAKQISLSAAPTPTTALSTIDAAAGAGSWGFFEGYKYVWESAAVVTRISPESTW